MQCRNCGLDNANNAKFCESCGKTIFDAPPPIITDDSQTQSQLDHNCILARLQDADIHEEIDSMNRDILKLPFEEVTRIAKSVKNMHKNIRRRNRQKK